MSNTQPAFPESTSPDGPFGGMILRDYFAAQALSGMLSSPFISDHAGLSRTDGEWVQNLAARAYQYADAILDAREKSNGR